MRTILSRLLVVLLISQVMCNAVWAQATAQINGAIQDQSGAVLPGVQITATQTQTGLTRVTLSNEAGIFTLPNLPVGPYKLEATLPGFRTFVQTGIVLEVNANPNISISLEVGQVSEQVQVEANAGIVETRNLSVGTVMETARIMDLPLNGRNAQQLLLLGGATALMAPEGGSTFPGRLQISSGGRLGASTDYTLDGIRHVDTNDGLPLPLPFPDALGEFKTEISGLTANQGQGAQVSAVTKSGTNEFHGDLFEFVRNDLFNARPYFSTKGSTLKRNQFGGTLGGPIQKNKSFFFFGYQGTTLRQDPADARAFVPTPAMLAGDFTAFASPECNAGRQLTLRGPFVNNRIDPSLLDPIALRFSTRLPRTTDPCGSVTYGVRTVEDQGQWVGKVDYQASANHSLFGRFLYSKFESPSALKFTPGNVLNANRSERRARSYSSTFGSTYLLGPSTVNAFRLGFNRQKSVSTLPDTVDWTELGSAVYSGGTPHLFSIIMSGGFSITGGPSSSASNLYQLSDDVSMTRGKHQFGFGGRIAESRTPAISRNFSIPRFSFSGTTSGSGLGDFLTGKPSEYTQGAATTNASRMNYLSLYTQDVWQVLPRLTASYGVRWAPIFPIMDYQNPIPAVTNFDIKRYQQGIRSQVFVNAPPGFIYPGDPGFEQSFDGGSKPRADVWNTYWKALSPRVGFAWDIRGDGKASLRASYGISYDEVTSSYRGGTATQMAPWGSLTTLIAPAGGLANPWLGIQGGNPFPVSLTKNTAFVPAGDYMVNDPNWPPTYTQSWNLSLQQEIARGTVVSASYLGTGIRHLQAGVSANPSVYISGVGDASGSCFLNGQSVYYKVAPGAACSTVANTQARRQLSLLNPAFANEIGRMVTVDYGANRNYNAMLLSIQSRLNQSIAVNANYTLSHCIGDFSGKNGFGLGVVPQMTVQDPNNHQLDRSNCEADQRHNFNLTAQAESPKFQNRILNLVGSGWHLSVIYRKGTTGNVMTSSPGTPSASRTVILNVSQFGSDPCLCGVAYQRPDLLLPDAIYLDKSGNPGTQYLNPAAFGTPKPGTFGNMGRVNIVFPATSQLDGALSREFKIRESHSMEVRVEAFNVWNSFRPGNSNPGATDHFIVDTDLSSPAFGQLRYALDPRILQFAIKYAF